MTHLYNWLVFYLNCGFKLKLHVHFYDMECRVSLFVSLYFTSVCCPDVVNPAHLFSSWCQTLCISISLRGTREQILKISSAIIYFVKGWIIFRATDLDWRLTNNGAVRLLARQLLSPNLPFWRETFSSQRLRPMRCFNKWIWEPFLLTSCCYSWPSVTAARPRIFHQILWVAKHWTVFICLTFMLLWEGFYEVNRHPISGTWLMSLTLTKEALYSTFPNEILCEISVFLWIV